MRKIESEGLKSSKSEKKNLGETIDFFFTFLFKFYRFSLITIGTLIIIFLYVKPVQTKSILTHLLNGGYFNNGSEPNYSDEDDSNINIEKKEDSFQEIEEPYESDQDTEENSSQSRNLRKRGIFITKSVIACDTLNREDLLIFPSSSTKLNEIVEELIQSKVVFTKAINKNTRLNVETDLGICPIE